MNLLHDLILLWLGGFIAAFPGMPAMPLLVRLRVCLLWPWFAARALWREQS